MSDHLPGSARAGVLLGAERGGATRWGRRPRTQGRDSPERCAANLTVRYEYTDGLRTKIVADLPSGSTDQETLYIYGTTDGTPSASEISTGHLLRAIVYPDSTNTGTTPADIDTDDSDVVSFAYDVQGQEVWKKDQAGNVFETTFDDAGKVTQKSVATLATGFDGAVRRIETSYDDPGRRETVVQLDALSGGNETDGVQFTYDPWGNLSKYEEDRNSSVGAAGSVGDYEVKTTWQKATDGRHTLRIDSGVLPSGASIDYQYRSLANLHDDEASRVTSLVHGTTAVVAYDYNGLARVVGTDYPEPEVRWDLHEGGTSGDEYPDLDRFDRVTDSRWTAYRGSATDLYDVDISYDESSDITWVEDHVHTGFDARYVMDGVDRLTRAEEGTRSGSSITSRTRDQQWTLDQVGNWE